MASDLTAVLFALSREAQPFLRRLRGKKAIPTTPCPAWLTRRVGVVPEDALPQATRETCRPLPCSVLVLLTGMGAEATTSALRWLLRHYPETSRVVSAGFCGSLVPDLHVGCVVQPVEVTLPGGPIWPIYRANTVGVACRLVSVNEPVISIADRKSLQEATGASVVDMESAAAAQMCREREITYQSLRVVSDDLERGLPADLLGVMRGEQVDVRGLCRAMWNRPTLALDLIRLARDTKKAASILSEMLERTLHA